jgi:hypothetical protein
MSAPDRDADAGLAELVILAISEDLVLLEWFRSLGKLPHNLRENAILQVTSSMAAADEDPDLILAVSRLRNSDFLQAVASTLADLADE